MLQRHFEDIYPEATVDARVAMYTAEAEEDLLSGNPDYVLDAIDNIDTKVWPHILSTVSSCCYLLHMPCPWPEGFIPSLAGWPHVSLHVIHEKTDLRIEQPGNSVCHNHPGWYVYDIVQITGHPGIPCVVKR
jgi:hypothetical protein